MLCAITCSVWPDVCTWDEQCQTSQLRGGPPTRLGSPRGRRDPCLGSRMALICNKSVVRQSPALTAACCGTGASTIGKSNSPSSDHHCIVALVESLVNAASDTSPGCALTRAIMFLPLTPILATPCWPGPMAVRPYSHFIPAWLPPRGPSSRLSSATPSSSSPMSCSSRSCLTSVTETWVPHCAPASAFPC